MLALAGIFVSSFVVGLSGALMPGPVLTVTIGETTRRGFWAGPLIVLGHGMIEFALFIALVLGVGTFLRQDIVFGVVGVGGAAVLIWMGIGMVRGSNKASLEISPASNRQGTPVWAGLLSSIANPYFILWWATIGLSYIALSQRHGLYGLGSFYSGHILSDLVWYSAVAAAITAGKRVVSNRTYRIIIAMCGIFLLALGAYFGSKGLSALI